MNHAATLDKSTDKPPVVETRNLHKSYGDHHVLKGISFTAHEGGVLSLIGSSGSGKSTLLRCINLLEIPNAGELYISGEQVKLKQSKSGEPMIADAKQVERIRTQLSMVFHENTRSINAQLLETDPK